MSLVIRNAVNQGHSVFPTTNIFAILEYILLVKFLTSLTSKAFIAGHNKWQRYWKICNSQWAIVQPTRCTCYFSSIHINQPTRRNSFTSLLLDVYVWLNMFRAPPRPSSGAYNCTRSLWFYRWRMAVGALLVVVWQTTTSNAPTAALQR